MSSRAEHRCPGHYIRTHLEKRGWSQRELASKMDVSTVRLNGVIRGKRRVTIETAQKLEKVLGPLAFYWMQAQLTYDLRDHGGGLAVPDQVLSTLRAHLLAPVRKRLAKARTIGTSRQRMRSAG